MENNTTFSNRESLQSRIVDLPLNDTFSNKVSLESILEGLGPNDTFSNNLAMKNSLPSIIKDKVGSDVDFMNSPIRDGNKK
jgi:hypothetical protein